MTPDEEVEKKSDEEIKSSVIQEGDWGLFYVNETILTELKNGADEEGCGWADWVYSLIEMYKSMQSFSDHADIINKPICEQIAKEYIFMIRNTTVVSYPEREVTVKKPAVKVREWI